MNTRRINLSLIFSIGILATSLVFKVIQTDSRYPATKGGDSNSYFSAASLSIDRQLSDSIRTLGYPLFLRVFGRDNLAKRVQILLFGIAIFTLFLSFILIGIPAWLSSISCLSMTWMNTQGWVDPWSLQTKIDSDGLGMSMAVLSVAFFLWANANKSHWLKWICLSVSVFVCYQIRPVYLFLIILLPFLSWVLDVFLNDHVKKVSFPKNFQKTAAVLVIPLLLFCLFRGVYVGHFGLVPFGAINMAAITNQLLDEKVIPSLPKRYNNFSKGLLKKQKSNSNWLSPIRGKKNYKWRSPLRKDGSLNFKVAYNQHNTSLWNIVVPTVYQYKIGVSLLEINSFLSGFNKAIIYNRFGTYFEWVQECFKKGLSYPIRAFKNFWKLYFIGLLVLIMAMIVRNMKGSIDFSNKKGLVLLFSPTIIALSFFLTKLLLISITGIPIDRYMSAAAIFFPIMLVSHILICFHYLLLSLNKVSWFEVLWFESVNESG